MGKQLSFLDGIEISLTQGYVALVDPTDMDLLDYSWRVWGAHRETQYASRRATSNGKTKAVLMHRQLMEKLLGRPLLRHEQVDHINGDGLDNRRGNLRLATQSENMCNRGVQKNNSTGFKGVCKYQGKYRAAIRFNGNRLHLGTFDTALEAHGAYSAAAQKYHGEFARLA